jgi:hypothetical protein
MDGKTFSKFCKDLKLIDKKFASSDVDILFNKIKQKTERRITYKEFTNGLNDIAAKKGIELDALKETISSSSGPILSGTVAQANKFHDDKSLYTGVHANGGPTNVDVIGNTVSFG